MSTIRWKLLGLVVFAVIITLFTLSNSTMVTVNFLFAQTQLNLVLVILLSVLLGAIVMAILWSIHAIRLRGRIRELRSTVRRLEDERAELETIAAKLHEERLDNDDAEPVAPDDPHEEGRATHLRTSNT